MQDKLLVAVRHVATGRRIVAKQRAIIARLEGGRYRTAEAVRTLDLFEQTLAIFEDHYQEILTEITQPVELNFAGRRRNMTFDAVICGDAASLEMALPGHSFR